MPLDPPVTTTWASVKSNAAPVPIGAYPTWAMPPAGPRAILPGPIRQNGHVVRDLDRSIESWLALGVGPWLVLPHLEQTGSTYRGETIAPVVSMAFANSGDLQVELIAPDDDS